MLTYYSILVFIFRFIITIHSNEAFSEKSDRFLAGINTPVWFIESNSKDPESPRLSKIPDALHKVGLILENQNTTSLNIYDFENEISCQNYINKNTEVLYLEILVVVDYDLYKKIGENLESALKYIVSFWNGVDLRYRLISRPEIHVNIGGIAIAKDPNALFYIHESKNDRGHVIANKVLFEGGKYFLYEKKFKNHDMVVTMTTENICSMSSTGVCYSDVVGLSLLGKACHSHLNTAIIEDNGAFSGIIPATHEIAHLLNVPHDGTGKAASCSTGDGYIMAPSKSLSENNLKWSQCSKNILSKLTTINIADCLRNKPNPGSSVKKTLPGKLLSVNKQCARAGYGIPCFNGKRICNALSCFRLENKMCDSDGPAAEGSLCAQNMICRNGECVAEN